MTEHKLKVWATFWPALVSGEKSFELRKNDRDFKVGDTLLLREVDEDLVYTGQELRKRVTFIVHGGFGLVFGHICMGLGDLNGENQSTNSERSATIYWLRSLSDVWGKLGGESYSRAFAFAADWIEKGLHRVPLIRLQK